MMTATIIIYGYDNIPFLKGCMRQVLKYQHPEIKTRILISEQGLEETATSARFMFPEAEVFHLPPLGSGYAVDYLVRHANIDTEYICTLDVDAYPIHPKWLYIPIKLLEDFKFSFVGVHADIASAYGGGFFCMCQYFRVGRTLDFLKLSHGGGFTKWDKRDRANMKFHDNWTRGWSDDAVIAHWWEDQQPCADKFAFATLQYLDVAPCEGRYGRNTDDLVFHMAFSYNWTRVGDKVTALGQNYLDWIKRINETNFSAELLDEMLNKLIPLEDPIQRRLWDGGTKILKPVPEDLNNYIDNLKNSK